MNYDKLESLAKERGISKTHLCQLVGRERYYLRDCKNRGVEPPEDHIKTWADALGTTADYLTDKSEDKGKSTSTVSVDEVRKLIRQLPKEDLVKLAKEFIEILGE